MKYIFYDTETTGLEVAYDQILQFAALEVDEDLNEINSINIRCRILPYIVPSPGALLVTGVSPKDLVAPNYSHRDMAGEIRDWIIRCSPCMLVGHNSIKFDETFLRHAFYRTLHPLYLTNTNGNNRADTMRMAQAAAIFAPGSITVPLSEKGNPSFRLGNLARANGIDFKEEDAHDALADVRATLELAKLLRRRAPEIWEQMLNNSTKKTALTFMRSNPAFCLAEVNYGKASTYLVSAITNNPNYDAEMAVFDLRYNPNDYLNCSVEELVAVMKGKEKAIRIVPANSQPIIVNTAIGHAILEENGTDPEVLRQHIELIQAAKEFRQRVATALTMRYEDEETSPHVEKAIYQGFPSRADESIMMSFHKAPAEEKSALCHKLQDTRYREMALRLIYADHLDHMDPVDRHRIEKDFQDRLLTEEKMPWLTIPAAFKELKELREQGDKLELLAEIEVFIEGMRQRFTAI